MLNYALLLDQISGMDKKTAVDHLHETHPHLTKSWFNRNYQYITALDPAGLSRILNHSDPTANKAVNNIMKAAA